MSRWACCSQHLSEGRAVILEYLVQTPHQDLVIDGGPLARIAWLAIESSFPGRARFRMIIKRVGLWTLKAETGGRFPRERHKLRHLARRQVAALVDGEPAMSACGICRRR